MEAAMAQDCVLCAEAGPTLVCASCTAALPRAHASRTSLAAFEYRFPLDRLVQRYKFNGDLAVGRWLAERLADEAGARPRPDLLVVPPLSRSRFRERGFNQSLEIARVVSARLRIPRDVDGIEKCRETAPQQGLGRRARQRNLRGAFRCRLDLHGRRVAIIDDVLTTGATAAALSTELRRAGATAIDVWTVARAPGPGRG
jgi:ComF family protein